MAIQYTFTSLVAAMQGYAEDDDVDFVANIPDMIGKAELRVLRDLDLELFEQWLEITVSGGSRTATKPADTVEVNDLWIRNPTTLKWQECPRRSFEYCLQYAPTEADQAVPQYYSEFDESDIYVVPTPDQSYSGGNARVRVTIRPTGLSGSNENTWLGDNMADFLFAACMIEVYDFLKHATKFQEAATKYNSLVPSLHQEIEAITRKQYKGVNNRKEGADT